MNTIRTDRPIWPAIALTEVARSDVKKGFRAIVRDVQTKLMT